MSDHDWITVRNRRWCLGCDLFQSTGAEQPFPIPRVLACPRTTPYAVQFIVDDRQDNTVFRQQLEFPT
jgi:hypothetical protein